MVALAQERPGWASSRAPVAEVYPSLWGDVVGTVVVVVAWEREAAGVAVLAVGAVVGVAAVALGRRGRRVRTAAGRSRWG